MLDEDSSVERQRLQAFLHACREADLSSDREVDSPDGGREVIFIDTRNGVRIATVDMADDGLIYLMLSNRSDGSEPVCDTYNYSTGFFTGLIKRIKHFLSEGNDDGD